MSKACHSILKDDESITSPLFFLSLSLSFSTDHLNNTIMAPFPNYSADGNYEVTLMTKATIYYNGAVYWQPPAIYKSSCLIDVEYFPYDIQSCVLKMGSWTYDGFKVESEKKNSGFSNSSKQPLDPHSHH